MSRQSLGLIETTGLAAAIEAADTAMKSANVTLAGYELTKGGGMVTVKLEGEVGAVNAAVAAATAAVSRMGHVYAKKIIPRPADAVYALIHTPETVGQAPVVSAPTVQETAHGDAPLPRPVETIAVAVIEPDNNGACLDLTASVTPEGPLPDAIAPETIAPQTPSLAPSPQAPRRQTAVSGKKKTGKK